MPKIVVSGIDKEIMRSVAPGILKDIAEVLECPMDWISLELVPSVYLDISGEAEHCPMVEIYWFKRPMETGKRVADIFSRELAKAGKPRVIIQIIDTLQENYFDLSLEDAPSPQCNDVNIKKIGGLTL